MSYIVANEIRHYWTHYVDRSQLGLIATREEAELRNMFYSVELGLCLMRELKLENEPLDLLPSMVNWTAVDYRHYAGLSDISLLKRNSLRLQMVRSLNAWAEQLGMYLEYPTSMRLYNIVLGNGSGTLSRRTLQSVQVSDVQRCGLVDREQYLQGLLRARVPHNVVSYQLPKLPGKYFTIVDGKRVEFEIESDVLAGLTEQVMELPVFDLDRGREPQSLCIKIPEDLEGVAQRLGGAWPGMLAGLKFCVVEELHDTTGQSHFRLLPDNAVELRLGPGSPTFHLVAMTGAGKTTLATLIAAKACEMYESTQEMFRVGVVFSSVNEQQWRTDLLNRTFVGEITGRPVAVPIFGEQSREKHVREFMQSTRYDPNIESWTERFATTLCLLQGHLSEAGREMLGGRALVPGTEPCLSLRREEALSMHYMCPWLPRCPSRRRYPDLVFAPVWTMNPYSLVYTRIPRPFMRPADIEKPSGVDMRVLELVAGHVDVMIWDEMDQVQRALDDIWASGFVLYGAGSGLYDANQAVVASFDGQARVMAASHHWIRSFMDGWKSVNSVTALLREPTFGESLRQWVVGDFFTLERMLRRATRLLVGMPDRTDLRDEVEEALEAEFGDLAASYFDILRVVMGGDPIPDRREQLPVAQRMLFDVRSSMMAQPTIRGMKVRGAVSRWVSQWVLAARDGIPSYGERIQRVREIVGKRLKYEPDSPELLERRLLFALALSNLRFYTSEVILQWQARPEIAGFRTEMVSGVPRYTDGLVAAPPLGQSFGFRIVLGEVSGDRDGVTIEAAEHTGVGRSLLEDISNLRLAAEGVQGPYVIGTSATSHMPGSDRFHVAIQPGGVLMPSEVRSNDVCAEHPVAESVMVFRPVLNRSTQQPIFVSGSDEREAQIREMGYGLCEQIIPEIQYELQSRGEEQPDKWGDRERVLIYVNSYDQVKAMGLPLAASKLFDRVILLDRKKGKVPYDAELVTLPDVEQIGLDSPRQRVVLVAPMQAVGRGLNILNQDQRAAFGAVMFAVRYYPVPGQFGTVVAAMHSAVYRDPLRSVWQGSADKTLKRMKGRIRAVKKWAEVDRPYYELSEKGRQRLAADTTALLTQAIGRLVRGVPKMVPAMVYFTDAAWARETALGSDIPETAKTSLLLGVRDYMREQVRTDAVFAAAHGPLLCALEGLIGV